MHMQCQVVLIPCIHCSVVKFPPWQHYGGFCAPIRGRNIYYMSMFLPYVVMSCLYGGFLTCGQPSLITLIHYVLEHWYIRVELGIVSVDAKGPVHLLTNENLWFKLAVYFGNFVCRIAGWCQGTIWHVFK